MEKKGDILNQLAIVSDLLENVNAEIDTTTVEFKLSNDEFNRVFDMIQKKHKKNINKPKDIFKMTIGSIDIVFNMNNV